MQPRRAGNIWSNEDAELAKKGHQAAAKAKADSKAQPICKPAAGAKAATQMPKQAEPAASRSAAEAEEYEESASEGEGSQYHKYGA